MVERADLLTDTQKEQIRRHCGYGNNGYCESPFTSVYLAQAQGTIEQRMRALSPPEVAVVLQYIKTLETLDESAKLDTGPANSGIASPVELYTLWRRRLCGFLGVHPGVYFDAIPGPEQGIGL